MTEPPIIPNRALPGTFAKIQWGFALAVAGFGSLFVLWVLVNLASDGFANTHLTKLETVCVAGTLVCPVFFVALFAFRNAFLRWPGWCRIVAVVCLVLFALPAFLATALVILAFLYGDQ